MSTKRANAPHVETCGVRFPLRTSDADALLIPVASTISDSLTVASPGRISRANSSGSWTVPGLALSHSASARLRAAMAAPRLPRISGVCAGSAAMQVSQRTWRGFVTAPPQQDGRLSGRTLPRSAPRGPLAGFDLASLHDRLCRPGP